MKQAALIFLFLLGSLFSLSQAADTLYINFLADPPLAKFENDKATGIEIDLLNEYINWLKANKKIELPVKYVPFTDAEKLYQATKNGTKNTIGAGGIVGTPEKAKEVDLTNAYLKNVAFCITNGNAPDIKTKNPADIVKTLGSMTALTIPNTNLSRFIAEIKKNYIRDLKVTNHTEQTKILDEIAKNVLNFGYVDAIEFWFYLKSNPQKFLKMQKPLNQSKEEMVFVTPKGGPHKAWFNEFFSTPSTGFKFTRNYRAILEKYVGSYMTQNMAIN